MGSRRSRAEWESIVAEHLRLGGTLKRDAALLGVHPVTLQQWTKRLQGDAGAGGRLPRFVDVRGSDAPTGLRVRCGSVSLEFETLPPAAWMAELLGRC